MSQLAENILKEAQVLLEGSLLSPKLFLHLATRAAVDQALSRLTKEGKLMRVGRGVYVSPHQGRFGIRPPSMESVVQAIEATGEVVVANGATEANALGLTTQIPVREVFLTSGASRKLHMGSRSIEFQHGQYWQLLLGKRQSGRLIRALAWLGQDSAPLALRQLRETLPESEWQAVLGARSSLPSWMSKMISEVAVYG